MPTLPVTLIALGFVIAVDAFAVECPPQDGAAKAPEAEGGDGLIAVIDPDTGRLTSDPSKAPVQAVSEDQLQAMEQAHQDAEIVVHPDGSFSADVSGLMQTPQVAVIDDGEAVTCHAPVQPEASE